ncbi:hypothetical protein BLNAU_14404 [Blattamonas nauphoetae]|uniref:Uncharacterized protein n=1 Tax=Blattamonas nauphoetae TaxID=2049346 RepID=A0ABQ9XHF6_9EUKA|nr:hypothetical protein BLNAU_14404 [Blattamonas nauphoetae]
MSSTSPPSISKSTISSLRCSVLGCRLTNPILASLKMTLLENQKDPQSQSTPFAPRNKSPHFTPSSFDFKLSNSHPCNLTLQFALNRLATQSTPIPALLAQPTVQELSFDISPSFEEEIGFQSPREQIFTHTVIEEGLGTVQLDDETLESLNSWNVVYGFVPLSIPQAAEPSVFSSCSRSDFFHELEMEEFSEEMRAKINSEKHQSFMVRSPLYPEPATHQNNEHDTNDSRLGIVLVSLRLIRSTVPVESSLQLIPFDRFGDKPTPNMAELKLTFFWAEGSHTSLLTRRDQSIPILPSLSSTGGPFCFVPNESRLPPSFTSIFSISPTDFTSLSNPLHSKTALLPAGSFVSGILFRNDDWEEFHTKPGNLSFDEENNRQRLYFMETMEKSLSMSDFEGGMHLLLFLNSEDPTTNQTTIQFSCLFDLSRLASFPSRYFILKATDSTTSISLFFSVAVNFRNHLRQQTKVTHLQTRSSKGKGSDGLKTPISTSSPTDTSSPSTHSVSAVPTQPAKSSGFLFETTISLPFSGHSLFDSMLQEDNSQVCLVTSRIVSNVNRYWQGTKVKMAWREIGGVGMVGGQDEKTGGSEGGDGNSEKKGLWYESLPFVCVDVGHFVHLALLPPSAPSLTPNSGSPSPQEADTSKDDSEGSEDVISKFMAVLDLSSIATNALPLPSASPLTTLGVARAGGCSFEAQAMLASTVFLLPFLSLVVEFFTLPSSLPLSPNEMPSVKGQLELAGCICLPLHSLLHKQARTRSPIFVSFDSVPISDFCADSSESGGRGRKNGAVRMIVSLFSSLSLSELTSQHLAGGKKNGKRGNGSNQKRREMDEKRKRLEAKKLEEERLRNKRREDEERRGKEEEEMRKKRREDMRRNREEMERREEEERMRGEEERARRRREEEEMRRKEEDERFQSKLDGMRKKDEEGRRKREEESRRKKEEEEKRRSDGQKRRNTDDESKAREDEEWKRKMDEEEEKRRRAADERRKREEDEKMRKNNSKSPHAGQAAPGRLTSMSAREGKKSEKESREAEEAKRRKSTTPLPHISPPVSATTDEARPRFSSLSPTTPQFVITPSVPSLFPKTNANGARGKDQVPVLSLQPNQHKPTPRRAQTDRTPTLPTSPLVTSSPQSPPFSSNTHASTSSPSLTPSVGDVSSLQAQLSKLQSLSSQQQQTITALEKVKETRAGDEYLLKRVIEDNKRLVLELKRVKARLSTAREQSIALAQAVKSGDGTKVDRVVSKAHEMEDRARKAEEEMRLREAVWNDEMEALREKVKKLKTESEEKGSRG